MTPIDAQLGLFVISILLSVAIGLGFGIERPKLFFIPLFFMAPLLLNLWLLAIIG